jgi:hypothetical protein
MASSTEQGSLADLDRWGERVPTVGSPCEVRGGPHPLDQKQAWVTCLLPYCPKAHATSLSSPR